MKTCRKGHQHNNKSFCPTCKRISTYRWRDNNPEKYRATYEKWIAKDPLGKKRSALRIEYGLTIEQWQEMLSSQNGCCKICLKPHIECRSGLHVDHDHKTKQIRGLLCFRCNQLLGSYEKDKSKFDRFDAYLNCSSRILTSTS